MKLFTILLTLFVTCSLMQGASNKLGQRYYLKKCSSCHGKGNRGGGLAATYEWKNYFKDDAKKLIYFHQEEKDVVKYLKSDSFKKYKTRMQDFLIEFANDSDKIPSCNN